MRIKVKCKDGLPLGFWNHEVDVILRRRIKGSRVGYCWEYEDAFFTDTYYAGITFQSRIEQGFKPIWTKEEFDIYESKEYRKPKT